MHEGKLSYFQTGEHLVRFVCRAEYNSFEVNYKKQQLGVWKKNLEQIYISETWQESF